MTNWSQDAGRNAPWRADGLVIARSDKGWWKTWKRDGELFVLQAPVFHDIRDAKEFAESL